MKASENVSKTCPAFNLNFGGARCFVEEFGIHVLLEVSLVGIVDSFMNNTVLSMIVGICIVEGCQFLWRKWKVGG